jgi:hypothetical protein
VEIERHGGRAVEGVHRGLSAGQVYELIAHLDDEEDTTVRICRQGEDGELLVAISGSKAFVGLTGQGGVFQYVGGDESGSTVALQIGGQATEIDGRYVVAPFVAADVAAAWVRAGRQAAGEAWERR